MEHLDIQSLNIKKKKKKKRKIQVSPEILPPREIFTGLSKGATLALSSLVVLTPEHMSPSPEELFRAFPMPRVSDSGGVGRGPRRSVSKKFLGASAADLELSL